MNSHSFSRPGRSKANQDSVLHIAKDNAVLLAIADGMGGKAGGDIASSSVIGAISEEFQSNSDINIKALFSAAKASLVFLSNQDNSLATMGTTLSLCLIKDDFAEVGHVGDTRIYHLRGNGLLSRTKDQTELQHLIDEGMISKRKAQTYHRKNILLSVLSPSSDYDLFTNSFNLEKGDRVLLISDGAYSLLSKSELRDLSVEESDIQTLTEKIQATIETKQIKDDYSAVIYEHS